MRSSVPILVALTAAGLIAYGIVKFGDRMDKVVAEEAIKAGEKQCKERSEFFGRQTKYSAQFGCAEFKNGQWEAVRTR